MPAPGEDPVANRSELLFRLFVFYLRLRFATSFHAVRLSGRPPELAHGRPVIVFGNHPSWWDPALYMFLAARLFTGRPGFGPMDQESLARYGFFRKLGIFGIDKHAAGGARRFLEVARKILSSGQAMLWVTAEGDFTDSRARPLRLRPGIAHLARSVPDALLVPLAVEYVFWNESKPEVLIRFGAPIPADPSLRPAAWNSLLELALEREMDALAQDAAARDPARFQPVLRGRSGASFIYDLYRRAGARASGRSFTAAHGKEV